MVNFSPKFSPITTPAGDPATEISDVPRSCWEYKSPDGQTVKDIFIEIQNRIRGIYIAWTPDDGESPSMTIDVIEREELSKKDRAYLNAFLTRFKIKLMSFVKESGPNHSLAMIPLIPTLDEASDMIDMRRRVEAISNLRRILGDFLRSNGFDFRLVRVRDSGSKPKATYVDFLRKDRENASDKLEDFAAEHGDSFDELYRLNLLKPDHPDNKEGVFLLIVEPKQPHRPS